MCRQDEGLVQGGAMTCRPVLSSSCRSWPHSRTCGMTGRIAMCRTEREGLIQSWRSPGLPSSFLQVFSSSTTLRFFRQRHTNEPTWKTDPRGASLVKVRVQGGGHCPPAILGLLRGPQGSGHNPLSKVGKKGKGSHVLYKQVKAIYPIIMYVFLNLLSTIPIALFPPCNKLFK